MRMGRWPRGGLAWSWLALLSLGSLLHFASYDFRRQPIATDIRYYLYYAAQTADGAVPYVDYFEHKTPLAIFVGAWLHRLGEILEVDPLYAIRGGYLLLAAVTATVTGVIFVRISNNRPGGGWIGWLAFCGFGLLGVMPAAGNIPKMIGMLGAGLAMLMVNRRRWFTAGVCVGVAALDWQPCGALAGLGVVMGGLCVQGRARNISKAMVGVVLAWLPVLIYFTYKSALAVFLERIFVTSLAKAARDPVSFAERCGKILDMVLRYCADERWLVCAAALGAVGYAFHLVRRRGKPEAPLLVGLACYHYGVVAFSFLNFQGHGDLFVLEGSMAFFSGVALVDIYYRLRLRGRGLRGRSARGWRCGLGVVAAGLLLVLLQPSFLRAGWRINRPPIARAAASLESQRQVAERLFQVVGRGRLLMVRKQELLFLGRGTNILPFATWTRVVQSQWRQGDEGLSATFSRLAESADPDAIVFPVQWLREIGSSALGEWLLPNYYCLRISSDRDAYSVYLWYRRTLRLPDVRGVRFVDPNGFEQDEDDSTESPG